MSKSAENGLKRKLAAILFADVVGYSRMIGEDDVRTTIAVKRRVDAFSSLAPEHSGEIVRISGDGIFMLFESAVDAVNFAIDIHKRVDRMNEGVPDSQKIVFRFGINLGDVLFGEPEELSGESINIAARIESFASPGRICVSGTVYDSIANNMTVGYEYLGAQRFKNIKEEVDVFQIHDDPTSATMTAGARRSQKSEASYEGDPIIDQSIVVLPFSFEGSETNDKWFADGLTEDITTSLSRFQQFFVISRGSAYVYAEHQVNPKKAAEELGVRYVVSGTVRKAGSRIRISLQLNDAIRNRTIWGEQYNREIEDLFDLQDEITQTIVSATAAKIEHSEV
ncbi:MAG: adenylate/guanylate cyclase domain-containing protein, partial [Pseudomonadota bacterium]